MELNNPSSASVINGREVMRIDGVYMYVVNKIGEVGAIMGFHPMVIVMYEDAVCDVIKGYLRVDRWIYPLAGAFSPVFLWGTDRLIMPDPFCPYQDPVYVVIRIPFLMSACQKSTLTNLLDVNAHVGGKLLQMSEKEMNERDKRFTLTEFTQEDHHLLNLNEETKFSRDSQPNFPPFQSHYTQRLLFNEGDSKLNVGMTANERKEVTVKHVVGLGRSLSDSAHKRSSLTLRRGTDHSSSSQEFFTVDGFRRLTDLPAIRGNIMRIYILGPRDEQHIKISTELEWIPVHKVMVSAVDEAFNEQVRMRVEKEGLGLPPTREGRKWRECPSNIFTEPDCRTLIQQATTVQNLEAAARVFDKMIQENKLELLSYAIYTDNDQLTDPNIWLRPLIPTELLVWYRRCMKNFACLNLLCKSIENDIVKPNLKYYCRRVHEDCEHHFPKLHPRQPLLDPKYDYYRLPPPYI